MLKPNTTAVLLFLTQLCLGQVNFVKTGMPSSYCQTGFAEVKSDIYIPLTLNNEVNNKFYSVIDIYDWQGQKKDSIEVNSSANDFYSIQTLVSEGDTLYTCGLKGTCSNQSEIFVGRYSFNNASHLEFTSIPNSSNASEIKGLFKLSDSELGFYTSQDVFIYDFVKDSVEHVIHNLIEICQVSHFGEEIIVASGSGLFSLDMKNGFSTDTLISNQIRLMSVDQKDKQVYVASDFHVIRLNGDLTIRDSLHLVNGPMNFSAPNYMYANDNRIYMLDGNRVYTVDSTFNFVVSDFSVALRNEDTYIKNFEVRNNQLLVFGAKGHYYYNTSAHPWFLGTFFLGNSLPLNFDFRIIKAQVDTLFKFSNNGQDFFKARFNYFVLNNSSAKVLNDFRANVYFGGKLCNGSSSQELYKNVNQQPGAVTEYFTGWMTFGPIDNVNDYRSDNTRFNISLAAFNRVDYGSSAYLSLSTSSYGFIGLKEFENSITLAPNPTKNVVAINGLEGAVNASIRNTLGQVVWYGSVSQFNDVIDLSPYPQGAYYLTLVNGSHRVTKKVLKQ